MDDGLASEGSDGSARNVYVPRVRQERALSATGSYYLKQDISYTTRASAGNGQL